MDILSFNIEPRANSLNRYVAIPFINGRSLIDYIREVEERFDNTLAGSYDAISPDHLLDELSKGSFLDTTRSRILECECGVAGCWPLLMKVTPTDKTIKWHGFIQYNKDNWDYSALQIFEFDKMQYNSALDDLKHDGNL